MIATETALRITIAQVPMQWTVEANLAVIERAMQKAAARGAGICVFSELAVTGFHRQIRAEAVPAKVEPAVARIRAMCRSLRMACTAGAPTFAAAGGAIYNSYLHIDEHGEIAGQIDKVGQTVAESTFFHGGRGRPVCLLQGRKTTAVMCREIEDTLFIRHHLPTGAAELILWPGLIGKVPESEEGSEPLPLARELARRSNAWIVQNNWPKALNLPDDAPLQAHLGGSNVISPTGEVLLTLPLQEPGLATFDLGADAFAWDAWLDSTAAA